MQFLSRQQYCDKVFLIKNSQDLLVFDSKPDNLNYELYDVLQYQTYLSEGDLKKEHVDEIADRLNVSEEEVVSMNRRLASQEKSLNDLVGEDGNEWQDWLVDKSMDQELKVSQNQEFKQRQNLFEESIHILNSREKDILYARRLNDEPTTLDKLSKKYKISRERIRQIENNAFDKLQKCMLNAAKSKNLLPAS